RRADARRPRAHLVEVARHAARAAIRAVAEHARSGAHQAAWTHACAALAALAGAARHPAPAAVPDVPLRIDARASTADVCGIGAGAHTAAAGEPRRARRTARAAVGRVVPEAD